MPPPEIDDLREWALLWLPADPPQNDAEGKPKRQAAYVELDPIEGDGVRLIRRRSQRRSGDGNVVDLDGTMAAAREIPVGSILWMGSAADLEAAVAGTGTGPELVPDEEDEKWEVVSQNLSGDLRLAATRREYGLKLFKGPMPEAA